MTARFESLHEFRIPLRNELVVGGRSVGEREGLFITMATADGARGVGEIAPLPGFHKETVADCLQLLKAHQSVLNELPLPADGAALSTLFEALAPFANLPSLHFGLSMAAVNLQAVRRGVQPAEWLDAAPLTRLLVNGLVMTPPAQWLTDGQRLADEGFRVIKIKVGRAAARDEAAALLALHAQLGDRVQFVLDGNRAWTPSEADGFLSQIHSLPLLYCEELLHKPAELAALQARSGVAMALDETLFDAAPPADLISQWPSVLVLKLDRIQGSLATGLQLAAAARERGQPAIVSSAFNTLVGWSFLVQVAAALHGPHAGLDTQRCYSAALTCDPACWSEGAIDVPRSWINDIIRFAPYCREVVL
ncbi:MAG: o-succinylbenzoate synthase [Lentisphaerae bacterium]|nr:o-succinylbenzoate synthase [Lentisphaerota bacterium]